MTLHPAPPIHRHDPANLASCCLPSAPLRGGSRVACYRNPRARFNGHGDDDPLRSCTMGVDAVRTIADPAWGESCRSDDHAELNGPARVHAVVRAERALSAPLGSALPDHQIGAPGTVQWGFDASELRDVRLSRPDHPSIRGRYVASPRRGIALCPVGRDRVRGRRARRGQVHTVPDHCRARRQRVDRGRRPPRVGRRETGHRAWMALLRSVGYLCTGVEAGSVAWRADHALRVPEHGA